MDRINKLFLFFAILFLNQISYSQQITESNIPFPITNVHFYSNQAEIERNGIVNISSGRNTIEILQLTENLISDSARVLIKDKSLASKIRILSLEVEKETREINFVKEAKETDILLKDSQSKLKKLTDQYTSLQEEEKTLKSIQFAKLPSETKENPIIKPINIKLWESNLDFVQNALNENHKKSIELLDSIDIARQELSIAIFISDKYKSTRLSNYKKVKIELDSRESFKLPVTLLYRTTGASWYPVYSARLDGANENTKLKLISYALVKNESGETWDNVKTTFSATDPNESASLPKLNQWKIESRVVVENDANFGFKRSSKISNRPESQSSIPNAKQSSMPYPTQSKDESYEEDQSAFQSAPTPIKKKSNDYFTSNLNQIQEKRANRKSEVTQQVLNEFQFNIQNRNDNLKNGNYEEAIRYSDLVIHNIDGLNPQFKKHFQDEQLASENIKKQSLEMQEKKEILGKLIIPKSSRRGYDFFYESNAKETIPSDNAFRKIYLTEKNLKTDLLYEANPMAQNLSYLIGKIDYNDSNPLLEGPISIFHNNDYLGESILKDVSNKEPFVLSLGADEDIHVTRTIEKFREKTGIINKSFSYDYKIKIKIKNRKKNQITIDVYDRIPVSSNDMINVKVGSIIPSPTNVNDEYGLYKFRLNIPPDKEESIILQYNLSHSVDVNPEFSEKGLEW
jgi:hypothetical protein